MVENASNFAPVTTTTDGTGAYIPTTYLLHAIMVVYDQPEYNRFATFTPKLDIYVDPTVATGTINIDNSASGSSASVSVGDRFILAYDSTYLAGDPRARYFVATSATTVGAGGTGSVNCTAESVGARYNQGGEPCYTAGSVTVATRRFINLYPIFGGGGSSGTTTYTVSTSGGVDILDPTHIWPNGSSLSTPQKNILITQTTNVTGSPINFTSAGAPPYTDPKIISTLTIKNNDTSPHIYYVDASGLLFSGKS